MKERYKMPGENFDYFLRWMDEREENFEAERVANTLKMLNDDFGAFTPRDGRLLAKEITVFGHKWVDMTR